MSMQGVKNEEKIELNKEEQARVRERSLKLLGEIIKPVKNQLFISLALVVTSQALRVSGPWLIALIIDRGIPDALAGDPTTVYWTVGGYMATSIAAGAESIVGVGSRDAERVTAVDESVAWGASSYPSSWSLLPHPHPSSLVEASKGWGEGGDRVANFLLL
jgi:hypothetical protein